MTKPLALLALLALLAAGAAHARTDRVAEHVAAIAGRLAPHLPRAGSPPPPRVIERAPALAGTRGGTLEISTGLLAALDSDAQLAMILAYEQCRALPSDVRRSGGSSAGARVGRAVAVGAAVGATAEGVRAAVGSTSPVVRGAVTGAAATAAGVGVGVAFDARRGDRGRDAADDRAAADGMRALVAAGFDGSEALAAWDRLRAAAARGGEPGGYADERANARRHAAASRALKATGQRGGPRSGLAVGRESYRDAVASRLRGWRLADASGEAGADPAAPAEPAPVERAAPAPSKEPWIVYARSGGFTGWSAELRVFDDGSRWARESQKAQEAGPRATLGSDAMTELRAMVARASSAPPRRPRPEAGSLRDGMARSLEVHSEEGVRSVALSDGLVLGPDDMRLVERLESLLR